MTELLQQAIAALERLPEETQDAIAAHLLFELVAFEKLSSQASDRFRGAWLWRSVQMFRLRDRHSHSEMPYPLRGTPVRYIEPTEPVASSDWEAI